MRLHKKAPALAGLGLALFMAQQAGHAQLRAQDAAPEPSSGYTEKKVVTASKFMIATANPHATRAGDEMLKAGGTAVDAAIAAAIMLNLTEPQSSGIGGGAFIMSYEAAGKSINAYDGREKAPATAKGDRFLDSKGKPLALRDAINSGKSVGVPGLLRVMELAHQKHGKLPWAKLFEPTIRLAESGFPVSERLHTVIKLDKTLRANANAKAYFYDAAGEPLAVGATLKNPAFAAVLRRVAKEGPDAFYKGEIARDISNAVNSQAQPGGMTVQDIADYQAKERTVLCGTYRVYKVCGMPPPSSGGIAVLAMLGALERFPMSTVRPNSTEAVHLFSEAGRLAYADRDYYVGDPDFVNVPATALVSPEYLKTRSALIRTDASMKRAAPGVPAGVKLAWAPDELSEIPATSHISVIDAAGNAVSMTTTIEAVFGSHIMVHGFLLNNQMTDFALSPEENGLPVANRIEGGKRPRSTMSPTLVFDAAGKLKMTVGSPGGSAIINYVAKTLVGVLDWGLDVQQAISLPNMGSRNRATEVELGSDLEKLAGPLKAMGHEVQAIEFTSGLQGIVVTEGGLSGGADPRREGFVMGE
ncbi:gamma-glutamyltransferase 1 . Threonine peptidase. MEROPS family T03 [Polaromonas sp. YR568]|uniref:gamma-glutamyltransferase n=1 Tax=Polaromonas sp. YR568 TaxID=1855301 RepID=UPI0008E0E461|nr:gamma-glutamyltransferase [Polaromonas sp. YR568]SFU80406.1 gamma-glutamyltransferase 1 . Threonine peptidase. MEROPS family T03 [Polaromonas sp. YR568]